MTDKSNWDELLARWRSHPPDPADGRRVLQLLADAYRAYEVPLDTIPASDYETDDDVVHQAVWKLVVITDPQMVGSLVEPEAFGRASWPPSHEDGWPPPIQPALAEILGSFDGQLLSAQEVGFRLLTWLVGEGLALAVVLESHDGAIVSGFKVYGPSLQLQDFLVAHIGVRRPPAFDGTPRSTKEGDIHDEDFRQYLQLADRWGLLNGDEGDPIS